MAIPDRDRRQAGAPPGEVRPLLGEPGAGGWRRSSRQAPGEAGPGGVGELAELTGNQVRRLLADVNCMVADPLEAARDEQHAQAPAARVEVVRHREDLLVRAAVRAVDQLVELDQRLGPGHVACGERVDRHADHLLGAPAHLLEGVDQLRVARQVLGQLDQLGDRHAVVGHPLEVEIRVQDREHEPQVDGDRRLPREQLLDSLLDLEIALVDLVVEAR